MSRTVIGLIGLLIFLFALFAVRQWYKTQQYNQILAQQISDAVEYKEKYMRLKRSVEADDTGMGLGRPPISPQGDGNLESPAHDSRLAYSAQPAELSDADLFTYLRDLIEREQLFLAPTLSVRRSSILPAYRRIASAPPSPRAAATKGLPHSSARCASTMPCAS